MLFNFAAMCIKKYMKNRDRMDIISRILEAANGGSSGGATRTKIMYNAFLSHGQLKQYLTTLADNGMVRFDFLSQTFKTTEKGLRFLKTYSQMNEMIKVQNSRMR
jgi:predicted transcriptional regulator